MINKIKDYEEHLLIEREDSLIKEGIEEEPQIILFSRIIMQIKKIKIKPVIKMQKIIKKKDRTLKVAESNKVNWLNPENSKKDNR